MRYVIERQYLLPIYQHLVIEADSVEDACRKAAGHDDWENAKEDGDSARATTIAAVKSVPAGLAEKDLEEIGLGEFLYGGDTTGIYAIPAPFADE